MNAARGSYDAIVVGAGPNGLAAAITLARAGRSVLLVEAAETVGGGCRSAALTLPGFLHDVCSAVHPLAAASPFFRSLPLADHGLDWVHPPAPLAHPLDDGTAVVLEGSLDATARRLGPDGPAYRALMGPVVTDWSRISDAILGPPRLPRHPVAVARFALRALRSARGVAESAFAGAPARALFAGLAAHSFLPLERAVTAGFGLVLGATGHVVGWPSPRGGAQRIADALAAVLRGLGGEIVTGAPIASIDDLPRAGVVLLDVTPRQLVRLAGARLPAGYRSRLERYRYGAAAFKVDFALDGPVPWKAAECSRAGTVHLGGTLPEIAAAEAATARGEVPERPFVLVGQQSLFDPTRAPAGKHALWTYCHVPHGCSVDMTARIEAQIERFAPGFRGRILARAVKGPADLERYNPNYVGGDINGGVQDFGQTFARPTLGFDPYATAAEGIYLCSSSTPPGGGVHGLCGNFAANAALSRS